MPVIINDLEVILDARDEGTADAPAARPEAPASRIAPATLDRVEMHRRDRAARVRAH